MNPAVSLEGFFEAPVDWLAILILRTTTDFVKSISYLDATGLLGQFDRGYDTATASKRFRRDIRRAEARTSMPPQIGFWLPQSQKDLVAFAQLRCTRYNELKRVYEGWLGPGSWKREEPAAYEIIPQWLYR